MKKIEATNLYPNIKRWLLAFLMDRRVCVLYQGESSKWLKSKLGLAQGAVSSPPLWNLFGKDLSVISAEVDKSFADDFHAAISSSNIDEIVNVLNAAATEIISWTDANEMSISAPKSSATLFTTWTVNSMSQLKMSPSLL